MICDGSLQPATSRSMKKASDWRWLVWLAAASVNGGGGFAAAGCWLQGGRPG